MPPRELPQLPAGTDLWRTEELHQAGFGWPAISRLLSDGTLFRLRRGCYARMEAWSALGSSGRERMLIAGHAHGTLSRSAGAFAYSHTSAARLHRLKLWNVNSRIHLTQAVSPARTSHGADVIAHTRALGSKEVVTIDGLPCTSLERTVVDCCLTLNRKQALILMDHALRIGADIEQLRESCATLAGQHGVKTLRWALDNADPLSESPGETLTRELLVRLKLPMPVLQFEVSSREGNHRMDFAWKESKIALEFDGKAKYFDYEPAEEALYKERLRERALTEDGWFFIRLRWRDLFREQEFKTRILRALGQRSYAEAA
ncbi:hypothetical protein BIU82_17520 [Arthrobacter sp. SW1]|uniref:hypothetical protein n=1 Tax=Arthrobacter sp. SW1 TaxID=1920889 RepID=UPI000877AFDE|nr:hypothetical protein [Arthrobacter sp. SW1]OFI38749.1 hypothetical protein BIU82_17520 [Arthrobacter sp. SW1]